MSLHVVSHVEVVAEVLHVRIWVTRVVWHLLKQGNELHDRCRLLAPGGVSIVRQLEAPGLQALYHGGSVDQHVNSGSADVLRRYLGSMC